jgi:hypothetical protein
VYNRAFQANVSFKPILVFAASNQDKRRNLLGFFGGKKNNQAAQAIDQSKFPFGGGINQGQAGKLVNIFNTVKSRKLCTLQKLLKTVYLLASTRRR